MNSFYFSHFFHLGLIFGLVEFEEWCSLYSMRCLSGASIQNYDCSCMGYLRIEHNPLMHMVATLDSSLELSLFFDAHQPIAAFLFATQGEPMHLSTR